MSPRSRLDRRDSKDYDVPTPCEGYAATYAVRLMMTQLRRTLLCVVAIAALTPFRAIPAGAQLDQSVALRLLVRIVGVDESGSIRQSGGIIVGYRADSLYVLTVAHSFNRAGAVWAQVTPQDTVHRATLVLTDSARDFAVVSVPRANIRGSWKPPFWIDPRRTFPYSSQRLSLIGCAPFCWWSPRAAVYEYLQPGEVESFRLLTFRSDYLEPGMSGGALVDGDGAVLGMVVVDAGRTGVAFAWEDLREALQRAGIPVNLRSYRGHRAGMAFFTASGDAFPTPGQDSDGTRFQPGWRLRLGLTLGRNLELHAGFDRTSFRGEQRAGGAGDPIEADAFVARYIVVGARARMALPLTDPVQGHTWSIGLDLLLGYDGGAVGPVLSDKVDVRTGERETRMQSYRWNPETTAIPNIGLRVQTWRGVGVIVDYGLYVGDNSNSPDHPHRLSVGFDTRWTL